MRKALYFTFLLFLSACNGQKEYERSLDEAASVINERPDSVLIMLDSLGDFSRQFSPATKKRCELLRLSAQNKCDTVFRNDSLQQELVKYYDQHGTANERMTAHYLLGRAYSDMGKAPMALHSFQNAIECADTTNVNCDYDLYSIIYIQKGYLFFNQFLPVEAIDCFRKAGTIAMESGNKEKYLNAMAQEMMAYYELNDFYRVDSITNALHRDYLKIGDTINAARVLGTSLHHALHVGDTTKAGGYFRFIFNAVGEHTLANHPEWAGYNALWGKYLFLKGQYDKAEQTLRKTSSVSKDQRNLTLIYKGLMDVYTAKGESDSIAKYATLYCEVNDSSNLFNSSTILARMQSSYDFSKANLRLQEMEEKAKMRYLLNWITLLIIIFLCVSFLFFYRRKKKRHENQIKEKELENNRLLAIYSTLSDEIRLLRSGEDKLKELLIHKEKELSRVIQHILDNGGVVDTRIENASDEIETIISDLHHLATKGKKAPNEKLEELARLFSSNQVNFINFIRHKDLSIREEFISILIRQGFISSEIAILLGISSQTLSNSKRKIYYKLFDQKGNASDLNDRIIRL